MLDFILDLIVAGVILLVLIFLLLALLSDIYYSIFPDKNREIVYEEERMAHCIIWDLKRNGELDDSKCYTPCRHLIKGHLSAINTADPNDVVYLN